MTLIKGIISGFQFKPETATVSDVGSQSMLSHGKEKYSLQLELDALQGWMQEQTCITPDTHQRLLTFLSFLHTTYAKLESYQWTVWTVLGKKNNSPITDKVQQLMISLKIAQWMHTREFDLEIKYNDAQQLEISNKLDRSFPLEDALKEIETWLSTKCNCFSGDDPQIQIQHGRLLTLYTNLLCIQEQLKCMQGEHSVTDKITGTLGRREKMTPHIKKIDELLISLEREQRKNGFFNQMPSNRDDAKRIAQWMNTREFDPKIRYNDAKTELKIINGLEIPLPLEDALKEIEDWLATKCDCFSEDDQQIQIQHGRLLTLLEVNLLCIHKQLGCMQKERNPVTAAITSVFVTDKISILLAKTDALLNAVKTRKLVRSRCMTEKT